MEFRHLIGAVVHQTRNGGRWILACEDPFVFAAGLFGLLHARCTIVLPPNQLPATLERLRVEAEGVLTDTQVLGGKGEWPLQGLPQDTDIEFWTSGSTETPKRVPRRFSHLSSEVEILESLFGHLFKGGPVLGTVPHHHIYGCLFRILWPLAAKRPFVTAAFPLSESLALAIGNAPSPVLVSSPAFLARLPHLLDLEQIHPRLSAVFSSGGPLAKDVVQVWNHHVTNGVIEVYGSTESGGIAWRSQKADSGDDAWIPFPDVTLTKDLDNALRLRCNRVPSGELRMEDAVDFRSDGRFYLQGRLDRVVKLQEKRVSLPEMEALLKEHPWVRQAALVVLNDRPRRMLGAALVLQSHADVSSDRKVLINTFRTHLARHFESVVIPKRWRFPNELPFNERGKLEAEGLSALFKPKGFP